MKKLNFEMLSSSGLNLQALLNINELPKHLIAHLQSLEPELEQYNQVLLVGHAGTQLWEKVQAHMQESEDPIDQYSEQVVTHFLSKTAQVKKFNLLFPSNQPIGLQQLGKLAGWHFDSPFRVGINKKYGSWFAYRAVALLQSDFENQTLESESPCDFCTEKVCVTACPAGALTKGDLSLKTCMDYRKSEGSKCSDRCLARMACPVAVEHQYSLAQIQYHYGLSYRHLKST